jgi:hypothetical protein
MAGLQQQLLLDDASPIFGCLEWQFGTVASDKERPEELQLEEMLMTKIFSTPHLTACKQQLICSQSTPRYFHAGSTSHVIFGRYDVREGTTPLYILLYTSRKPSSRSSDTHHRHPNDRVHTWISSKRTSGWSHRILARRLHSDLE